MNILVNKCRGKIDKKGKLIDVLRVELTRRNHGVSIESDI